MRNAFLKSELETNTIMIGLKSDWIFENVRALRRTLDDVDAANSDHVNFQCGGMAAFRKRAE